MILVAEHPRALHSAACPRDPCSTAGHTSTPCPAPTELSLPSPCSWHGAGGTGCWPALAPCLCQPQRPQSAQGRAQEFLELIPSPPWVSVTALQNLSGWRRAELVNLHISGKPSGERVQRKGCQVHSKVSSNCKSTAGPFALAWLCPCSPVLQSVARQGTGHGSTQGAEAARPHCR